VYLPTPSIAIAVILSAAIPSGGRAQAPQTPPAAQTKQAAPRSDLDAFMEQGSRFLRYPDCSYFISSPQ